MTVTIRPAAPGDLESITEIYRHHVLHGVGTFEEIPPDLAEMTGRYEKIVDGGFPYFVAENEGEILGYAYAAPFRHRSAYRFTVEDSVYIAAAHTGKGIGKELLNRLAAESAARGYQQMVAVIGGADPASMALHRSCGFIDNGRLEKIGFKFDRWLDIALMRREL